MYHPPRTATQRAWLIDEVVRDIMAHLPPAGRPKTLANCARVSRAVSEPALDVLWSRLTELSPLWNLLPDILDNFDSDSPVDGRTVEMLAVDDAQWSRFTRYARRVRVLHYPCRAANSEWRHRRTLASLARHATRFGVPLLPRLEELSWLQFSRENTDCLRFLSPSLRRITIYCNDDSSHGTGDAPEPSEPFIRRGGVLLSLLNERSPGVEELSLEGVELPSPLAPMPAFAPLRSLHLGSMAAPVSAIIAYCSAMPNLSSLSVDLSRSDTAFGTYLGRHNTPTYGVPPLQALQSLRIVGAPAAIEELLEGIRSPSLRSAKLCVASPEHDREGGARCVSLLTTRFANSLESVRVEYKRSSAGRAQTNAPRPFSRFIRPLLAASHLRHCTVVVEDVAPTSMTDEDVAAMAEAWPALTALEVSLRSPVELPAITALAAFSRCCPDLASLRLPISQDVSALDSQLSDPLDEHQGGHGLRSLWLSGVYFSQQDSRGLMRYLTDLFPEVNLRPMMSAGVLRAGGAYSI
ncbi:hypothetical protein FKP32DRAFT_1682376 [Trametes sanguinea]|nr:hypothetical protein FKP32DRAFT_1682376 [Trametes sanguinea]